MSLEIRQESVTGDALAAHGSVSIAFEVDRVLAVTLADGGIGGISLTETAAPSPYLRDHDASQGEGPERWARLFDLSNWGLLTAWRDVTRAGGAVIAFRTPSLYMLEGRDDVGALRLRTVATKDRPCADFPYKDGETYDPAVILDLDYWVLMPR